MDVVALVASAASLAGLLVAVVLVRSFLPSYIAEKGRNAASKEDLAQLTELVESVKTGHLSEIERLKSSLLVAVQVTERRRRVYEEVCLALRVFVEGHGNAADAKERFHASHAAAWLWASDEVLFALNRFIQLQVEHAAGQGSVEQRELKNAYAAVVLAMRKDVGFSDTATSATDYKFVKF